MADPRTDRGTETVDETRTRQHLPRLFKVILHNDDYTTMEFVVRVLESVFLKTPAEAYRIMMLVHTRGWGSCGVYPARDRGDQGRRRPRPGARTGLPPARELRTEYRVPGKTDKPMFSASVEMLLHVAYREATSRRHVNLTLEHLLYVLAHDIEGERDPRGVRRRPAEAAQGARRVPQAIHRAVSPRLREGTRTDARVPARAADRGPARPERRPARGAGRRRAGGHPPAAQLVRRADARGPGHHPPRRAQLHLARHHQGPDRGGSRRGAAARARRRGGPRGSRRRRAILLGAYALNLTERARAGALDPLIGRTAGAAADAGDPLPAAQEQPGVRR